MAVVGVVFLLSNIQVFLFSHPPRQIASDAYLNEKQINFQIVELTTSDGIVLNAWYTPPQNGVVILVAHPHAGTIHDGIYALLVQHGYGVLAWDFRAHGKSGGEFSSLGYYEVLDVKAALDYVLSQPDVKIIGGWGGSMGAATLILSAAKYPEIEAIVADSSFSSLQDEMEFRVGNPIYRKFVRLSVELQTGVKIDDVSPVDVIGQISPRAVFITQGMRDTAIPVDSAQRLFDAAGEPRFVWTEEKAYHLNMYPKYPKDYEELVINFYNDYLRSKVSH